MAWYRRHGRTLPWRAAAGEAVDPYRVWLSEIMLQQTQVVTVIPYYGRFLDRWPRVEDLAAASLDDVLHAWQGLGYYARARNLHRCAVVVAGELGGRFPDTEEGLRRLPGIGAYTAAAVAAIAYQRRTAPVDGNIIRVVARLHGVRASLPGARIHLETLAGELMPPRGSRKGASGDFAQALMDLGATVCTPKSPRCGVCPWTGACRAEAEGRPTRYPVKAPAGKKPTRRGVAFWMTRKDGAVLLRRRPEKGLLGGMMEVPSTPWRAGAWGLDEARAHAPEEALKEASNEDAGPVHWHPVPGVIRHAFTHFHLELMVLKGRVDGEAAEKGVWCPPDRLGDHALPAVMKKIARHALEQKANSGG